MIVNQAFLFLVFILVGAIIGLLFDFFRILRRSFKTNDIFTYIQDIIFWILTGIIVLIAIFYFSNGEIRFFMFIGLLLGIIFYLLLFSKYIIKISIKIIALIRKILTRTFNILKIPFTVIYKLTNIAIYKPFKCIIINLTAKIQKIKQFSTKIKQNKIKKYKKQVNN